MKEKLFKIDEKDKKILKELFINSRQSFSKIGKKVGLPKNVVAYRVKKIIDKGLINLFCTVIDKKRMGYLECRLLLKFHHFNECLEKRILSFLKKTKKIHWVATLDGNYDFCIIFLAKNLKQINEAHSNIIYNFSNFILEKDLSIELESYHLPYNFIFNSLEKTIEFREKNEKEIKLDETNKKIINFMKQNSRITMLELMDKTKLSPQVIRERIKKMEKDLTILGYKLRIEPSFFKLNNFHVFLRLTNLSKEAEKEILIFLSSFPSTIRILKEIGKWDLQFECVFPSHFQLHDFLKKLKNQFPKNIQKIESALIYKVHDINTVKY